MSYFLRYFRVFCSLGWIEVKKLNLLTAFPLYPSQTLHTYTHQKTTTTINHQRNHTNKPETVLSTYHTPAIQSHIYECTDWNKQTYDTIDWSLLETCMTTLNNSCRTNVVKFIHDWQNFGSQTSNSRRPKATNLVPQNLTTRYI